MSKKNMKIAILLIVVLLIALIPIKASAMSLGNIINSGGDFINQGEAGAIPGVDEESLVKLFVPIMQILMGIGTVVLVMVTIFMGIKYVRASPEEAAKLKQQLTGLVVSVIVIFGAQTIWALLYNLFENF